MTATTEQRPATGIDRKVFDVSGFDEGTPHHAGVMEIMHGYFGRIDEAEGGTRFVDALAAWDDRVQSDRTSPQHAWALTRRIFDSNTRVSIDSGIGLGSATSQEELLLNKLATHLRYSYSVSRFAAEYIDDVYGAGVDQQGGQLTVRVAPTVDPERFVEAKMSIPIDERGKRRIPYSEFMASSKKFDDLANSNLRELSDSYKGAGVDFDPEATKWATSTLVFLKRTSLPSKDQDTVRHFRNEAAQDILRQDFDAFNARLEELILTVPEAIAFVSRTDYGLTKEDIGDLRESIEHQKNAIRLGESANRAAKKLDRLEKREAWYEQAKKWVEHGGDDRPVGSSVWKIKPVHGEDSGSEEYVALGQLINDPYNRAAFRYVGITEEDAMTSEEVATNLLHSSIVNAGVLMQLCEYGLVERVDGVAVTKASGGIDRAQVSTPLWDSYIRTMRKQVEKLEFDADFDRFAQALQGKTEN